MKSIEYEFQERYKALMKTADKLQILFAMDAFEQITTNTDTSKITVFSPRCGIGKSTTIKAIINYFALDIFHKKREDCIGMVIVTDSIKRLKEFNGNVSDVSDRDLDYEDYSEHEKLCTLISSDNNEPMQDQIIKSMYKPFVLISTQKYYSMDYDQRELLFNYKVTKNEHTEDRAREILIFDEKPYFLQTKIISIKNIELLSVALFDGIPSDNANKDWILREYQTYRDKMAKLLRQNEKVSDEADRFYWKDYNTSNLTCDDEKFFQVIKNNKITICKVNPNAINDLLLLKQLMAEGGFFISQKNQHGQDYKTFFSVLQDNRDSFYLEKNKIKIFVFDATANIDPEYDRDYVEIIDSSPYDIKLNLHIISSDVNTSHSKFNLKTELHLKTVAAVINNIIVESNMETEKTLIATYSDVKDKFKDEDFAIGHFGYLKGSNSYIDFSMMAHVGLNRYSDFAYFMIYLSLHPEEYALLKTLDEQASRKFIAEITKMRNGLFINLEMNKIMMRSLLSDFEQNIFRTSIRKYDNTEQVIVRTYWSQRLYEELNRMIHNRYKKLGATFEDAGVPIQVKIIKAQHRKPTGGKKQNNTQKILEWSENQPKGREFKISDLLQENDFNNSQWQRTKRNKGIRELFEKIKTDKQGYYQIA